MSARASSLLGRNLRRLRGERGWTLAETARRTGLSIGTLSKVENGLLSLTFANLSRLADGLGVSVAILFAADTPAAATPGLTVTRRGKGLRHAEAGFELEYLCASGAGARIVPVLTRVKARTLAAWGPALRHAGEEFAYVLKGTVDLALEGQPPVRLEAGDSVIFDSGRAHAAAAVGDEDALLLSAIMPNDAAASVVSPSADRPGEELGCEVPLERPVRPAGTRARNGDARERGGRRPRRIQDEHR
jgi:transcriptional regulator with XRE-family HTH domain